MALSSTPAPGGVHGRGGAVTLQQCHGRSGVKLRSDIGCEHCRLAYEIVKQHLFALLLMNGPKPIVSVARVIVSGRRRGGVRRTVGELAFPDRSIACEHRGLASRPGAGAATCRRGSARSAPGSSRAGRRAVGRARERWWPTRCRRLRRVPRGVCRPRRASPSMKLRMFAARRSAISRHNYGDRRHRGRGVALAGEQVQGGVKDRGAGALRRLAAPGCT